MAQVKWVLPNTKHQKPQRDQLRLVSMKLDNAFIEALKQYSSQQSESTGLRISQSVALKSLALQASPELRKLYQSNKSR